MSEAHKRTPGVFHPASRQDLRGQPIVESPGSEQAFHLSLPLKPRTNGRIPTVAVPPASPIPDSGAPQALFAARAMSQHNRAEMREALDAAIRQADRGRLPLRVPHEVKPVQNRRGMHYHYR